jgi:hypothetical protein
MNLHVRALRIAVIASALALAISRPALSQAPTPRQGTWWAVGLAYGRAAVRCDICLSDRGGAASLTARFGVTVSPHLLLGVEASGWRRSEGEVGEKLGGLTAVAEWYPDARRGLHIGLGFGVIGFRSDGDDGAVTGTGLGLRFGGGYDVRVAHDTSVTPYLQVSAGVPATELNFEGEEVAGGVSFVLFQVGLALTRH